MHPTRYCLRYQRRSGNDERPGLEENTQAR